MTLQMLRTEKLPDVLEAAFSQDSCPYIGS